MAKRRLNKKKREVLQNYARDLLFKHPKVVEYDEKIQHSSELLRAMAYRLTQTALSDEDKRVLDKFGYLVQRQHAGTEVVLHAQNGWSQGINWNKHYRFRLQHGEEIYGISYSYQVAYPLHHDHPFWDDVEAFNKLIGQRKDFFSKKCHIYHKLISNARYLEEVLEVWPEAEGAELEWPIKTTRSTALASLTKSDRASIQADVLARAKQQAHDPSTT